tara:strand:- start:312 stop:1007 length:696 start_codon:yes stop_codon:yes gene_type:complete
MTLIIDMHVHTKTHSSDSMLDPQELIDNVPSMALNGLNISEHDRVWDKHKIVDYTNQNLPFFCSFGIEVATDYGHVVAIGLTEYISGIHKLEKLREEIDKVGGFIFIAHPFRYKFDKVTAMRSGAEKFVMSPKEASKLPVFDLVHGIEIANGGNTLQENHFAYEVASYLNLTIVGGSDAHSLSGLGYYATKINANIGSQSELIESLHSGATEVVTLNQDKNVYDQYMPTVK